MEAVSSLGCSFVSDILKQDDSPPLLFSVGLPGSGDCSSVSSEMALLGSHPSKSQRQEQWFVRSGFDSPGESGCQTFEFNGQDYGQLQWYELGDYLFLGFQGKSASSDELSDLSFGVYQALLSKAGSMGYEHLLRAWNYFDKINEGAGDDERYRLFCKGRYEAFIDQGFTPRQFPAASALGHQSPVFQVYLIATKQENLHFENPDQVSAYEYPRQYGPKSPSFARATASANLSLLLVSGTASIVGHETLYLGNVERQLKQTLVNIERLLRHVEDKVGSVANLAKSAQLTHLKVYVRHASDALVIEQYLNGHYPEVELLMLEADVCRAELLVEIEAIASLT